MTNSSNSHIIDANRWNDEIIVNIQLKMVDLFVVQMTSGSHYNIETDGRNRPNLFENKIGDPF